MEHTYNRPSVTLGLAQEILRYAVVKAVEDGGAFAVSVVDESGVQKAFARMDGAPVQSVQIAHDKAYTAAGFGMATDGWFDFIKEDEPLRLGAPTGIDRLAVFGGGYPITIDGAVVGGIGVSGGHYRQDMAVAEAGLHALDPASAESQ
ncbi:GlcG/HbpS family heme-binding protein [Amycolatopsis jiangsuensis]|uniref:Uncharacterized protein GlcG (DUF336 family) n=1 Tax=Amycolatopsis jiangsuensis TaxID=1181879 RepID=A0A840J8A2_9PSEU|nr:heme-binding protein [Amycolatopsis jiangsuensis]MBB4689652.1 uncharacterized protein GlcG (DUF336 family) [Amycolatopsis jiangsuensis]